jgi:phosphoribosylformimino-5-aminoimidazole carboxamide ribonucleotide (ProFAR) isomerase
MQNFGCARIIFTDIARDGTLAGPNAIALREMAEAVEIPVIASGGVHKATDVRICAISPTSKASSSAKRFTKAPPTCRNC